MPRRSFHQARQGQVYAIDWPEWHVQCADCEEHCHISSIGECSTAREAERLLRENDVEDSSASGHWKKKNGLWYCPIHAKE